MGAQGVKNLVKSLYSGALCHTGALAAWLRIRPGRGNPWILNYHHIGAQAFESHLQALQQYYRIVPLDACWQHATGRKAAPPNSVALTFDDAYGELEEDVFPLLARYDAQATVFVPTDAVERGEPLWFNRVKAVLQATDAPSVRLGGREFALAPRWQDAYVAIIPWLNQKSISERDALVTELLAGADLSSEALAPYLPLTWEQMRAAPPQVTFGAHTRTHPFLSRLPRADAEDEIAGSKAMLEDRLGVAVRHFAYPFGGPDCFTEETVELVRAAGFSSAVTTIRGACQAGAAPYRLPRILFDGSIGGNVVAARLSGLWLFLTT